MLPTDDDKTRASENKVLLLPLLLLLLGLGALLGLRAWRDHEPIGERTAGQPRKPCDPPASTGLPNAPGVAGLEPVVLLFSPDCRWVISGNRNGSLHVIDPDNGRLLAMAPAHASRVRELIVTADGRFLFSSAQSDPVVLAWSLPELRPAGRFDTDRVGASAIAWNDATRLLFTAGGAVRGWRFDPARGTSPSETARPLFTASSPGGRFDAIAVSPDGWHVATASMTRLQLWRLQSREKPGLTELASVAYERMDPMVVLSFSADGKHLVSMKKTKALEVRQVPGLAPQTQAAASPPTWEYFTDPGRLTVRPPRSYSGPDKMQLVVFLHDSRADRLYNALAAKENEPYAVRGELLAAGAPGGLSIFDFFARPRPVKIVSVPTGYGGR